MWKKIVQLMLRNRKCLFLLTILLLLNSFISMIFQTLIYVNDANAYAIHVNLNNLKLKKDHSSSPHRTNHSSLSRHSGSTNPDLETDSVPLLTLFTTFKDIPRRLSINKMTIDLWSRLPKVNVVMYTELSHETPLAKYALKHGWSVYRAPSLRLGYPVLKDMFLYTIQKMAKLTPFVAYANSDILFTKDLEDTLLFLSHLDLGYVSKRGLLVAGRRINTLIDRIHERVTKQHMRNLWEVRLDSMDSPDVIDFFLTTKDGYPWHKVPDFVVGKPGYDNWLLKKAVEWDLLSIDVSLTVSALHQTYNSTHGDKGWLSKDVCINRDLVEDKQGYFPYYMGRTTCLKYFTDFQQNHPEVTFPETTTPNYHRPHLKNNVSAAAIKASKSSYHGDILLFQRQAMTRYCYPPLALPFIGVRWYKSCSQIARTKTMESEKYKMDHGKSP